MPISQDEVIKAISKLKRKKSPGLDLLPPELFIDAADLLCSPICTLFNHIFANNTYPESWKRGVLVPVPKKGDLSDANNYMGITLTSIFSKLYSHILDNRLRSWTEENNVINENQFGNGKFFQAQKYLSDQASKALFALSKIFDSRMLCIEDKIKLFDALVQPILMYGCKIWGFHKANDIEKVHLKFLKQILGVRRQTCNIAVYGEVGRVPLYVLRKVRILKYWYKILSSQNTLLYSGRFPIKRF